MGLLTVLARRRAASAAPPVEVVGISSTTGGSNFGFTGNSVGWQFTVGASDITVTHLRMQGVAGSSAAAVDVTIWRVSDGAAMVRASVDNGSVAQYAWAETAATTITGAVLAAGETYRISSWAPSSTPVSEAVHNRNSTPTFNTGILTADNTGVFATATTADAMPTTNTANVYAGVDFRGTVPA